MVIGMAIEQHQAPASERAPTIGSDRSEYHRDQLYGPRSTFQFAADRV